MFESFGDIRYDRPVDGAGRRWWMDAFHDPLGLTPLGMAKLLTKGIGPGRSVAYHLIDGVSRTFSATVWTEDGRECRTYLQGRTLHVTLDPFEAETAHGAIKASGLVGFDAVAVQAVGSARLDWLRLGVVPSPWSWGHVKSYALSLVAECADVLGDLARPLARAVEAGTPHTARWLAALDNPVPRSSDAPFGKVLFLERAPDWQGTFTFDPPSMRIADEYAADVAVTAAWFEAIRASFLADCPDTDVLERLFDPRPVGGAMASSTTRSLVQR